MEFLNYSDVGLGGGLILLQQPANYAFSANEHPLQAATSALLNVNGEEEDQGAEIYGKINWRFVSFFCFLRAL